MPTTNSNYPLDAATTISAQNPTQNFGVAPVTYGGSPGAISVPASTAPTAVPIAMQQGTNVYNQLPGYGTSLGNVGSNIAAETAGKLPSDVVGQIAQVAGERGIETGMPGSGASNANLLQALGLNSLALTNTGQKNLEGILPLLPGNKIAESPSLYATPQLYEGASASSIGLGNQNVNQNAGLSAAQAGQANAQTLATNAQIKAGSGVNYPTINPSFGGGGGGTGGTRPTGALGGTPGTAGTPGVNGAAPTSASGYSLNSDGQPVDANGNLIAPGLSGDMGNIPSGNMDGGSPTGTTPGQTYMGANPTDVSLNEDGQPVDGNGNPIAPGLSDPAAQGNPVDIGSGIPAGYVPVPAALWDDMHGPQDPPGYLPASAVSASGYA